VKKIVAVLSFLSCQALAFDMGLGFSSFTSGGNIPALFVQTKISDWMWDATTTGFASQYDYFSGVTSAVYKSRRLGQLFSQDVEAGFGAGVYVTQRGYRSSTSSATNSKSDFGLGPAFYLHWQLGNKFFVRGQSLLGIGHAANLGLFFQDSSSFAMGVTW
jgi:hypothetical protein